MRIIADTNLLVRILIQDNADQARAAEAIMAAAELVAIPTSMLCELVWVLKQGYRVSTAPLLTELRNLVEASNVRTDRLAVEAGFMNMEAGGDFADGVIAYEGGRLGGETFVSFDRRAVRLLAAQGFKTRLPNTES